MSCDKHSGARAIVPSRALLTDSLTCVCLAGMCAACYVLLTSARIGLHVLSASSVTWLSVPEGAAGCQAVTPVISDAFYVRAIVATCFVLWLHIAERGTCARITEAGWTSGSLMQGPDLLKCTCLALLQSEATLTTAN